MEQMQIPMDQIFKYLGEEVFDKKLMRDRILALEMELQKCKKLMPVEPKQTKNEEPEITEKK